MNPFMKSQGQQPTTNIFSQNNQGTGGYGTNQGTQGNQGIGGARNIFSPNQQQNNIFSQGQTQNQPNIFMNNQQQGMQQQNNNMFSPQGQGQQNNIFSQGNNPNQNQGNMFNRTGQTNNIFTQGGNQQNMFNPQQNNIFNTQQNNGFGQQGFNNMQIGQMPGQGNYNLQNSQLTSLNIMLNMTNKQQKQKLFKNLPVQFIKECIILLKTNLQHNKINMFSLSQNNPLKDEKIATVAKQLNISQDVVTLKFMMQQFLVKRVDAIKDGQKTMKQQSSDLVSNVFNKLQTYKQRLIQSISQSKMIDQIKKDLEQLNRQMNDFFRPLINAHQQKSNHSFVDPDPFILSIAQKLLRRMTVLQNSMDELLACEQDSSPQQIDTADIISQLLDYYQNVVALLRDFGDKFNKMKKQILQKNRQMHPQQANRKISQKAANIVAQQMQMYELVKQVQNILANRQRNRNNSH